MSPSSAADGACPSVCIRAGGRTLSLSQRRSLDRPRSRHGQHTHTHISLLSDAQGAFFRPGVSLFTTERSRERYITASELTTPFGSARLAREMCVGEAGRETCRPLSRPGP